LEFGGAPGSERSASPGRRTGPKLHRPQRCQQGKRMYHRAVDPAHDRAEGTDSAVSPGSELLGLPAGERRARLASFMAREGEPAYRSSQVEEWIFRHRARSFDEMTTLPAALRGRLAASFTLTPLEPAYVARSRDGTVKHLWRLHDGEQVESVLIPGSGRMTLCLSSQVGCALACQFCATGHFGFRRQLRAAEIVGQYRDAARFVATELSSRTGLKRGQHPISNVVYMGMGEPLANLDAVIASLEVLNRGYELGARRITVSTVGLIPGIMELARQPESYELAVSLHAPLHDLRLELMPIERRYPLPDLFEALREYQARKSRRISFEYTLIEGVNDDPDLAEALADLTFELTCFVNVIPFNPIPYRPDWRPSSPARIRAFVDTLERRGVGSAVRTPRGRDIAAACGQLRLAREGAEG
jgi:23S rRNA (adenine2503-C2)-methyltransferase